MLKSFHVRAFIQFIEAISKKGFWFKIAAGPRFHAKPDDASILIFKGAP